MKVFLDMDGVLADFVGGSLRCHQIPLYRYNPEGEWDIGKVLGMTDKEFWAPIDLMGDKFWEDLPPTSDGWMILALVEHYFGEKNICLLSSPSNHPGSASGKLKWIRKHLPEYRSRYLLGPSKGFVAGPGKLLVDDRGDNVDEFYKMGGEAILVARPWNRLHKQTHETLQLLSSSFDLIFLGMASGEHGT